MGNDFLNEMSSEQFLNSKVKILVRQKIALNKFEGYNWKESTRLHLPVIFFPRTCTKSHVVAGLGLPGKTVPQECSVPYSSPCI